MTRKGRQSAKGAEADQVWRCEFMAAFGRCGFPAGIYPAGRKTGGRCSYHYDINPTLAGRAEAFDPFVAWAAIHYPDTLWAAYPKALLFEIAQGKHHFEPKEGNPARGWALVRHQSM